MSTLHLNKLKRDGSLNILLGLIIPVFLVGVLIANSDSIFPQENPIQTTV